MDTKEIYHQLCAPFPEEAVERTKGTETRKGYDTTGIKYQYIVNRLNDTLGLGGFRVEKAFNLKEGTFKNGAPKIEATCDITMQLGSWQDGKFIPLAEAFGTGGHISGTETDAKKGAFTNGFKKVAAMFGCGWQAYTGTIDDDNPDAPEDKPEPPKPESIADKMKPDLPKEQAKRVYEYFAKKWGESPIKEAFKLLVPVPAEDKDYLFFCAIGRAWKDGIPADPCPGQCPRHVTEKEREAWLEIWQKTMGVTAR